MPLPRFALPLLAATALVAIVPPDHASAKDEKYAKLAPFTATRLKGETVHVEVDGAWYELVALDDTAATEIVAWCRQAYSRKWLKRFSEDLVEVLSRMGHAPGATVSLDLVGEDGTQLRKDAVPMTKENRKAAWRARKGQSGAPQRVERIRRAHAQRAAPEYADLLQVVEGAHANPRLTAAQAAADLDQLEWAVESQYSYGDLTGVDVGAAFDAVRLSAADGIAADAFSIQLMKLLGRFGDGHTRVDASKRRVLATGYAPFLVGDAADGVVAFHPTRVGFLDEDHRYLRAIDGKRLDIWLEAAARIAARGSPQFVRTHALRNLRYVRHLRRELGLPESDHVVLGLTDATGKARKQLKLRLIPQAPVYGAWPRAVPAGIPEDIGYLRIASMDDEPKLLRSIDDSMRRHAKTKGLVIDVRGNGGGTRDILRRLMPYLLPADSPPTVTNVARYRLRPGDAANHPDGHLANRFLFPRGHTAWSDAERNAIDAFAARFRPDWEPAAPEFSEWHYMLVSPRTNVSAVPYAGKVVVLTDAGCFSATDVFVGALAQLPNVELVGSPTSGGSGRSQSIGLVHSRIRVRLSSMASFAPTGSRYDGRGIPVDVEVAPQATDFLGTTDAVLEAALERLR